MRLRESGFDLFSLQLDSLYVSNRFFLSGEEIQILELPSFMRHSNCDPADRISVAGNPVWIQILGNQFIDSGREDIDYSWLDYDPGNIGNEVPSPATQVPTQVLVGSRSQQLGLLGRTKMERVFRSLMDDSTLCIELCHQFANVQSIHFHLIV